LGRRRHHGRWADPQRGFTARVDAGRGAPGSDRRPHQAATDRAGPPPRRQPAPRLGAWGPGVDGPREHHHRLHARNGDGALELCPAWRANRHAARRRGARTCTGPVCRSGAGADGRHRANRRRSRPTRSGRPEGARKVVEQIEGQGGDAGVPAGALIDVLIGDGDLEQAEQRFLAEKGLSADDQARLRLELARAWTARGELDRAEHVLGADSSIDAVAQRGWIALYRGNVVPARDAFRDAGPYAGDRADATRRTEMLALITDVDSAQGAKLGTALLLLARGDSASAVDGLRTAAAALPTAPRGGVLVLAGRVAAALDSVHQVLACDLFQQVVDDSSRAAGAAPAAAELEWARLLEKQNHPDRAITHLEHLILQYPASAVVPEARRMLDRLKGSVPRSCIVGASWPRPGAWSRARALGLSCRS